MGKKKTVFRNARLCRLTMRENRIVELQGSRFGRSEAVFNRIRRPNDIVHETSYVSPSRKVTMYIGFCMYLRGVRSDFLDAMMNAQP